MTTNRHAHSALTLPSSVHSVQQISVEKGPYYSRYFNFQIARKFILRTQNGDLIEVTRYEHYKDDVPIDVAVDIPTMVGCPIGCHFCAAAPYVRRLSSQEIIDAYCLAISDQSIDFDHFPVYIASFQGIGEPTLCVTQVANAIFGIRLLDKNTRFSISTTAPRISSFHDWTKKGIHFSTIQFSITGALSSAREPLHAGSTASAASLLALAQELYNAHECRYIKFNYILMNSRTDRKSDADNLISLFANTPFLVKISFANETSNLSVNKLAPAQLNDAINFTQYLRNRQVNAYLYGAYRPTKMSCGQLLSEMHC